ncbi:hypothetical protein [Cupriavidus agavae]|uniref:Uncharacterized protein n=1 Tax=Cupriavidus agavae TaxID=1001822 RepID=A0A4Q7RTE6_9BURK|nr:hypothetical protein [Cupriavidus agavae]RZT36883.1 hypothetical protein EV147_3547 [Cupriavidus agavae]
MKQHLAKSLLMAGALVASYPLLAQQFPAQQAQPMPAPQSYQPAPLAPPPPVAAPVQQQPNPYAQGSMQGVQTGVPPAPGAVAPNTAYAPPPPPAAVDPASMSLPPDALGTRLGQRNPFLDGA